MGSNNKNKTRNIISTTKKTAVEKKRNKREGEWIPFYVRYVHIFSCPDLHVIHSILFFHLILFYFSLSSPSVIPSPFFLFWGFVVGDERRFCHRPSAHSANHQYTHYKYVYAISIDSIEVQFYAAQFHDTNRKFCHIHSFAFSVSSDLYWPCSFVQSQILAEKNSNRSIDRICLCVSVHWCRATIDVVSIVVEPIIFLCEP